MIKRTLWYACLVLLCCSAGVLVVMATSAGKTTLVSDGKTSVTANLAMDIYLGAVSPEVVTSAATHVARDATPATKEDGAAVSVRSNAGPNLSTTNPLYEEQAAPGKMDAEVQAMSREETKPVMTDSKAPATNLEKAEARRAGNEIQTRDRAEQEAEALERAENAAREAARIQADRLLKQQLETGASAKGVTSDVVGRTSTVELANLVELKGQPDRAGRATLDGTSSGSTLPSDNDEAAQKLQEMRDAAVEAAEPVSTPEPEVMPAPVFESYPDFAAAGESAGQVIAEETAAPAEDPNLLLEKQANELIGKDRAGGTLTPAEKAIITAYVRTHPASEAPRVRDNLDDNGGTTTVYSGAALRIPPTGTGGTDTTFAPITIAGSGGPILDVEVEIDSLIHTYVADCDIYLRAPSGTTCELSTDNGPYGGGYYARCRFDDDATTLISTVTTSPITGNYKPEGVLTVFDGQSGDGIWKLVIYDDVGGDTGVVFSWRIQLLTATGLYADDYMTSAISSPAAGTTYAPSSSVSVTALFMNYGSATQTSPVEYSFNGGGIVSETTPSLAQYATDNHTFATQITMPATPGVYELVVRSALTTDEDLANDTLRRNVNVDYDGFGCATVITFATTGPDSLTYNNTGAGDDTPGLPCYDSCYSDMIFQMVVPNGEQGEIWKAYSSALDFKQAVRWGGACPGTNLIYCWDTPDYRKFRIMNFTGADQTLYFTGGGYSTSGVGAFKVAWWRQPATIYTVPYTSSFEIALSATVPYYMTFPDFWTTENNNADTYVWSNYSGSAANGTYCAYMYAGLATGNDDWLFSPGIILNASTNYYLDYFRKAYSTTIPESLEVKIGTQNASSAMSQTIAAWDTFKTNVWVEKGQAFTVAATDTYFVGYHSYTRRAYAGCWLDSMRILIGACSAPTVTANAATGTYSATLTSTVSGGHGGPVQYQWFTGDSCVDGNQIPYANSASYVALASGTYSLRAWRADSVNCVSCDSAEATVTSPCVAQTIPYIDNLDDVTAPALPACWLQENTDGVTPSWVLSTGTPLTAPNDAYIYGAVAPNGNDWLFTEPLSLTGGTAYVFQYWRRSSSPTIADCVQVKYGTSPLSGAMAYTIQSPETLKTSTIYVKKASVFTPATTGTYYVGINSLSKTSSAGTRIDSVHVYAYGPCAAPAVNVPAASGQYSVTLTATATGGFGGPYIYQWYTGETCTDGNEIVGATTSKYTAWAAGIYACRVYCGPDSVTCATCDSALVTLTCTTPTVPMVSTSFEAAALPTCWTQENTNNDAYVWVPYSGSTYARTGTYSARIQYNTSIPMNDWLFSQGLQLSQDTTYSIEYWYRSHNTTQRESLEVKVGTSPSSTAMLTTVRAGFGIQSATYACDVASFTPPSTGTYFIGWHGCSITNQYYIYLDDIRIYSQGSCAAPSVTVNNGTGSYSFLLTATATGGYGGPYYYQWYTSDGCSTANAIAGANSSTYTAWAAGIYSCQAGCGPAGVCVACDSGNVVLTCTTPSTPTYFEGFESTTGTALPTCWTYQDLFYVTNYWRTTTTTPYQGLRDAYMYGYSGTGIADDWMYTSGITLQNGTTYWLDYYRRNSTATASDSLEVMYGALPINTAMTNVLAAADTNKTTTWVKKSASFAPSATGTYFIGFHCMSRWSSTSAYTYIDNVRVYETGTCGAPDSVRVAGGIGGDSLVLTANVYGGYGGLPSYQWYTDVGCQTGNEITGATNKTYTATATGIYSVKGWLANSDTCAACDSANVIIIDCSNRYAPLSEGFETVTTPNLPVCWSKEDFNAPDDDWVTTTSYPHSGTKSVYISYDLSLPLDDWLYSVGLNLSADTTYRLKFYYRAGSSSYVERMEVSCGRVATRDSMIYSLVPAFNFSNAVYDSQEVPFTPPATGRYFFGFHAMSITDQLSIYVDDIMVWATGTCSPPATVTVNAATGEDSVKLRAAATGGTGGAYQYQWYTGDTCSTDSEIVGATTDSLWVFAGGSYSCKVWIFADSCSRCDSAYADVIDCDIPMTVPWSQNFDLVTYPVLPTCWTQENVNADTRYWQTSTSYYRSAPNSAYISYTYYGDGPENDWLYSRAFSATAGDSILIEYWYRMAWSSQSYTESLELYAGTAATAASMTIQLEAPYTFNNIVYAQRSPLFVVPSTGTYYIGWHAISIEDQGGIAVDDIRTYPYGECGSPDSVRANAAVGTLYTKLTANVYGGYGGALQYQWYTGVSCQAGNEITGETSADYYATASGIYSVKAWRGSDPDSCWACDSAEATINPDPCAPVAITPFSEGFESTTGTALPTCWSYQDLFYATNYWRTTTTTPHAGLRDAYMYGYSGSGAADDWMYTPPMVLQADSTYILDYWRRNSTYLASDCLEIKYGTIPANLFMSGVVAATDTNKTTTWVPKSASFVPTVTDTYYVGFHCMSRNSATSAYTYVDDVMLYKLGTCNPPDSLRVNSVIGSDSVTLTATVYGGIGGPPVYRWFSGSDCNYSNLIADATTNQLKVYSSGIYSVRAWKYDSVNCAVACDSAIATVINCAPGFVPFYAESFDGISAPAIPYCWSVENTNADAYTWVTYNVTGYPLSPPNCARIQYNTSAAMDDWLFSAGLNLSSDTTYTIEYWYRAYTSSRESLAVNIGTAPNSGAMATVLRPGFGIAGATWRQDTMTFTPPSTAMYYVGWHGVSITNQYYLYLDDIKVYVQGGCNAPTVAVADSAGIESATMKAYASGGYGGPPVYQWYTGGTCQLGNEIAGATSSTYLAATSGTYSCRIYMADSVNCAACDSGVATVTPAPFAGYGCSWPIFLSGLIDSADYNNCGMGDNSPGQSCGHSEQDMVFAIAVPDSYKVTMWQSFNDFDSRHSMRLLCTDYSIGVIGCIDDPDYTVYSYTNCSGATDTVYFIVGGYYNGDTYCGNFKLQWQLEPDLSIFCPAVSCSPTVVESESNDGCWADSTYDVIACGDIVSGDIFGTLTLRDVDAFQMTTDSAKNITVTVASAFNSTVYLYTDTVGSGCPVVYRDSLNAMPRCSTESKTFGNVPAGLVYIYVTTPFGESCGPQDYCMTVACTTSHGEDCADPIILTPPPASSFTQVIGTTAGFAANYTDTCDMTSSTPDVIYKLTLTECRRLTFSLDSADLHISVYEQGQCGVNAFLCNDDKNNFSVLSWEGVGQRPVSSLGSFCGGEIPAGDYYIRVARYGTGTSAGVYKLTVYDNGPCPCQITCQGGDIAEVTESRYDTTFYRTDPDGGCGITPPSFDDIAGGQTICGVVFNYQRKGTTNHHWRDTDWYLFTITNRNIVTLTVNAEFPAIMAIVDTNACVGPVAVLGDSNVVACTPTTLSDTLDAGIYAVAVTPKYFVGNPLPSEYRASLTTACLVWPVDSVTTILVNADADPVANDVRIRWMADSAMVGVGTYTVYYNADQKPFPGNGWAPLATGITPVAPPTTTYYDDLNVISGAASRRFYLVVGTCQ